MLPFENEVAEYVEDSGGHVLYRIAPVFVGEELVARGVLMEAKSIEDDSISFCVFCYNVQPGIEIDYTTGESRETGEDLSSEVTTETVAEDDGAASNEDMVYVTKTGKKYHSDPTCSDMSSPIKMSKTEAENEGVYGV